jgi:hypothetical protein
VLVYCLLIYETPSTVWDKVNQEDEMGRKTL